MTLVLDTPTHKINVAGSPHVDNRDTFYLQNGIVMQSGSLCELVGVNSYVIQKGLQVDLSIELIDRNGDVQTQIDQVALGYPSSLMMPVGKFVTSDGSGQPVDLIYMPMTITNGVISVSGTVDASGNWRVCAARVNDALKAIGAGWKLAGSDVTFLV